MTAARLQSIQGLRGLAALLVVANHVIGVTARYPAAMTAPFLSRVPATAAFGASGVDLFFVISGFVMVNGIAGRGADVARVPARREACTFLLRRAIRILPLFWLVSAAYILLQTGLGERFLPEAYANTLTLLPLFDRTAYHVPPLYVGWTLAFESGFYGLVALVLAIRPACAAPVLLIVTALLALAGTAGVPVPLLVRFLMNPIVGEFALGVGCWMLWRRGVAPSVARFLVAISVLLLLSGLCINIGQGFSVHFDALLSGESGERRLLVWGVPWALMLLGLVGAEEDMAGWLARVGDASYSLYLTHPFVITIACAIGPLGLVYEPHALVVALIGLSLGLGLAVYRWIERPLLRGMERWLHPDRSHRGIAALAV